LAPSTRAPVNSDGLILDLDGVVWRSGEPIAGAAEAIAEMRNGGARIVFVTNDPGRSPEEVALSLTRIGIPANADDVVTAADAVAELLVLRAAPVGRVLVLGPEPLRRRLLEADFDLAVPDDGGPVDVVVIGGHERFDYGELRAASSAVLDGAELIATSRDALYPTATGRWPATGAVVAAVEAATGTRATIAGKPSPTIFELARDRLGMPGGGTTRHLAVVGDHLEADIAGGAGAGLDTVLVLTGIATAGDVEEARVRPDLVVASLAVFAQLRRQQGID
jgi:HAD superfamily hydrolase (TIGR01450 family)